MCKSSIREERMIYYFIPPTFSKQSPFTQPWFLSAIRHYSTEARPLALSPVDRDTVGLSDLWAFEGCKSSDTCLCHICSRTHGCWFQCMRAWAHVACVCVSDTERERDREAALPRCTYDGSVGGEEKNELISLSSGGISPIYFQANRRWLMSWSKASSLFLFSLLSSRPPLFPLWFCRPDQLLPSASIHVLTHSHVCVQSQIFTFSQKRGIDKVWIHMLCSFTALCLGCQLQKVYGRVKGLVFQKIWKPRQCYYQKSLPDIISW